MQVKTLGHAHTLVRFITDFLFYVGSWTHLATNLLEWSLPRRNMKASELVSRVMLPKKDYFVRN